MANLMVSFDFYPGFSLVAMATKLRTKWAMNLSVYEISARFLSLYGGFRRWAIECYQYLYVLDSSLVANNRPNNRSFYLVQFSSVYTLFKTIFQRYLE